MIAIIMIDRLLMPNVILSASYYWILTNPGVCVCMCVCFTPFYNGED